MPYLTPESVPSASTARTLFIPDDYEWLAIVKGALLELCFAQNWEQSANGISVADAVQAALTIFESIDEAGTMPIACRIRPSEPQGIPNATPTLVNFGVTDYDTGAFFNPAFPTIVSIPEDGLYTVRAAIEWRITSTTGFRILGIETNHGQIARSYIQSGVAGVVYWMQHAATTFMFSAGDIISLSLQHTAGSTQPIYGSLYGSFLEVVKHG